MSNAKTISSPAGTNTLYKLQDNSPPFVSNSFPIRRLVRSTIENEQAWINAYRAENKKYFEAILTNQKLSEQETEQLKKQRKLIAPKPQTLKKFNFADNNKSSKNPKLVDGFFLMQTFCIEDPLDLTSVDISYKGLNQIKEEDMALFENICEINANENFLSFESFKCLANLKCLFLACNNIKTIRLKHDEFSTLESLDLSFNNLMPSDVVHLGVLKSLKFLKLTGNNLNFLPDTFSKLYVYTKDNKKVVQEKFPVLEELYLDHNRLKEEESFDVLSVLKKLKRLYLNSNNISCIPNLKIFRKNHVYQEFNKSYYKRRGRGSNNREKTKSATSSRKTMDLKLNESIVKDLDRPSSEMHNSNMLRNSFILEENEDEVQLEGASAPLTELAQIEEHKKMSGPNSAENFEKAYEMPFPELVFINLADNQIEEEDDLIAISSWPMLNEIILYGNPIVYNNVGYTPLIKKYLIERLGINVQRQRPMRPLRAQPVAVPQRENRLVDSVVPKIPKMPIDMRMLTYYHDALEDNNDQSDRSNLSSAESVNSRLNKCIAATPDSIDTVGHKNQQANNNPDHVFKPFKKEKNREETENGDEAVNPVAGATASNAAKAAADKDFNSFFMTQIDQDETQTNQKESNASQEMTAQKAAEFLNKEKSESNPYEFLFNIENEDQIKVPKDIGANVRALKHMLNHPLILREPASELDKPQAPYRTAIKERKQRAPDPKSTAIAQPRVTLINNILDTIKERKTVKETNLAEALVSAENRKDTIEAKRLFEKAQKTYDQVRKETIKNIKNSQPKARSISMNSINSESAESERTPATTVQHEDDEENYYEN